MEVSASDIRSWISDIEKAADKVFIEGWEWHPLWRGYVREACSSFNAEYAYGVRGEWFPSGRCWE